MIEYKIIAVILDIGTIFIFLAVPFYALCSVYFCDLYVVILVAFFNHYI